VGLICTIRNLHEKMAKALAEFKFRRLGKHFLWNQATMMRFRHVRYCTLSEVWDYWRNKADGNAEWVRKFSWCMGRLVPAPHSY
jgi:hypothetical protein